MDFSRWTSTTLHDTNRMEEKRWGGRAVIGRLIVRYKLTRIRAPQMCDQWSFEPRVVYNRARPHAR